MIWGETSRCGSWLGDDPAAARAASCGWPYPAGPQPPGDTAPWLCWPVAARQGWRRPGGFWLGRRGQTQVQRSPLALALSSGGQGMAPGQPPPPPAAELVACDGARVLCAHGGLCRAGRPERLGYAGAQVPRSCGAQPCMPTGRLSSPGGRPAHGGSLSPGGEGPTQPAPSRTPSIPYATLTPMTSSKPCWPSQGRESGGKVREQEDLVPCPVPPRSVLRSVGARASLWPSWPLGLPKSLCLLPCTLGCLLPPPTFSSHFPLSFLCASFFCRSLKPPSFITPWTGSRYYHTHWPPWEPVPRQEAGPQPGAGLGH